MANANNRDGDSGERAICADDHKGTALITGASTAVGAIYADRLARRGYDMILVSRNNHRLGTLATTLSDTTGRAVEIVIADLADPLDLMRVETVLRTDASITMLVSGAGAGAAGPLLATPSGAMADMTAINITAFTKLIYAVAPGFVTRERGTFVNIASIAAIVPEFCNGFYSATKAFVLAFSRSLHHELKARGIRVQAVLPADASRELRDSAGWHDLKHQAKPPMIADDLVDIALAGLDRGDVVTIPDLPDNQDWTNFEAACLALAASPPRERPS